jgi:integrase/recombinase XerD
MKQISVICDHISALRSEIKLSDNYRQSILTTLMALGKDNKKEFRKLTRTDIIAFLNRFRREDSEDPSHKWIGTYNTNLISIIKFFKWLYSPKVEATKRPKPKVVQNLCKLKRREISGYKPSHMWEAEDNLLFLKYCPNARDKCYHGMVVDTSARPQPNLLLSLSLSQYLVWSITTT